MNADLRLRRLERRCQMLTTSILSIAGLLIFVAAQRADPQTLRTQRLEIVDEQGAARLVLGREPGLRKGEKPKQYQVGYGYAVIDADGRLLTSLKADNTGSRFAMFHSVPDDDRRCGIFLTAYQDQPTIDLHANGQTIRRIEAK